MTKFIYDWDKARDVIHIYDVSEASCGENRRYYQGYIHGGALLKVEILTGLLDLARRLQPQIYKKVLKHIVDNE